MRWFGACVLAMLAFGVALAPVSSGGRDAIRPGAHPFALTAHGTQPDVAVDSSGTAHVVWNEIVENGPDVLHYCRVPAGGRSCGSTVSLVPPGPDDPKGSNDDTAGPRVLVTGPHQVVLLSLREIGVTTVDPGGYLNCTPRRSDPTYCHSSGYRIWEWTSNDGGLSFGVPHIVSHQIIWNGAATPLQIGGDPYVGIFGTAEGGGFGFAAPPLGGYVREPALLTDPRVHVAAGAVAALHDDTPVVAWEDASQATSKIFLRRYAGVGDRNDAGFWTAPLFVANGSAPLLAAGASGPVYLLFRRPRPGVSGGSQYALRWYDGRSVHAPGTVSTGLSADEGALAADDAGGVHVAWVFRDPGANRDELRYRYAADGTSFDDAVELAQGAYQGIWHVRLAAGQGNGGLAVFQNTQTGNGTITAARFGSSSAQPVLDVGVAAMEVTQAVQTQAIPTRPANGSSTLPYIGVRFASDKKTVVRVWATSSSPLPAGAPPVGVPSTPAMILRAYVGAAELPGGPLVPEYQPATLPVHAPTFVTDDERTSSSSAYEFTLPWQWTEPGTITLVAQIDPQDFSPHLAECRTCGGDDQLKVVGVKFFPTTRMQIFPVLVTVNGTKTTYAADPAAAFSAASAVYPFPIDVMPWQGTLDASSFAKEGEPDSRADTLSALETWADIYDSRSSHLISGVVPANMGIGGISRGGGVLYSSTQPVTVVEDTRPLVSVAHELGHAIGRVHADLVCGGNSNGQTGEAWPPNDDGALDGVGLDTRGSAPYPVLASGTASHPGLYYDLMSYCPQVGGNFVDEPHWTTVRNWERALSFRAPADALLQLPVAPQKLAASRAATRTLFVRATLEARGVAVIRTVEPDSGSPTPDTGNGFQLVARDANARAVATAGLSVEELHIDGGPQLVELTGKVAADGAASLAVLQNGRQIAGRAASAHAPVVRVLAPSAGARVGGRRPVVVRWHASDADGDPLVASVDYSADGGRSWRTVETGPSRGSTAVPATLFAASRNGRLRVRVGDGFHETVALSGPLVSLEAPPTVQLLAPTRGAKLLAGAALALEGHAFSGLQRLRGAALTWLDGARVLGHGERLTAAGLAPGRHRLTLAARGAGGVTKASVVVAVASQRPGLRLLALPKTVPAGAASIRFRAAATYPATLLAGGSRFAIDTTPRTFAVRIAPGHGVLQLTLTLTAGRLRTTVAAAVARR